MPGEINAKLEMEVKERVLAYMSKQENTAGIPSWSTCLQNIQHKQNKNSVTRAIAARTLIALDPTNDARDRCVLVPFEWAQKMARLEAEGREVQMEMENDEIGDGSDGSESHNTHLECNETPEKKKRGRQKKPPTHGGKRDNQTGRPKQDVSDVVEDVATRRARKVLMEADAKAREHDGGLKAALTHAIEHSSCISSTCGAVGKQHTGCECMKANEMLHALCVECNDGEMHNKIFKEGMESQIGEIDARKRVLLELKNRISVHGMDDVLKETGRKAGRRARDREMKKIWAEVDELALITDLPGEIEGVYMGVVQAVRLLLADLETRGVLKAEALPEKLEFRFSFDGTNMPYTFQIFTT
jgi:hypothetical protein